MTLAGVGHGHTFFTLVSQPDDILVPTHNYVFNTPISKATQLVIKVFVLETLDLYYSTLCPSNPDFRKPIVVSLLCMILLSRLSWG